MYTKVCPSIKLRYFHSNCKVTVISTVAFALLVDNLRFIIFSIRSMTFAYFPIHHSKYKLANVHQDTCKLWRFAQHCLTHTHTHTHACPHFLSYSLSELRLSAELKPHKSFTAFLNNIMNFRRRLLESGALFGFPLPTFTQRFVRTLKAASLWNCDPLINRHRNQLRTLHWFLHWSLHSYMPNAIFHWKCLEIFFIAARLAAICKCYMR